MTARPIIFSAPMVRALLDGQKTQTRRIVKPQPVSYYDGICWFDDGDDHMPACPYGQPGDLLWVRETWFDEYDEATCRPLTPPRAIYRATERSEVRFMDDDGFTAFNRDGTMKSPWRPSIHMPRWASRLTLRITDVRVQRLQEISEADARAEGAPLELRLLDSVRLGATASHTGGFERLWESIHGPDSWASNPWVWCLSFRVIHKNIDEVVDDD